MAAKRDKKNSGKSDEQEMPDKFSKKLEKIINEKAYHTVYELKNGLGPAPIKTREGWLHLAHGVRNTAAGLRYVLYLFMTDLEDISRVKYQPGGYFMAPRGEERIGDVSNVPFANGWISEEDGKVLIYYASSDTRMHVAVSSIERLVDYCVNTTPDDLRTENPSKKLSTLSTGTGSNNTEQARQNGQACSQMNVSLSASAPGL